ncbi:hypothetical protein CVM73_09075 [Bradyrhizobium forestalis]|uniref:Uncharacterized protein n=1 Tax=Bradyrhizobium forestalis TaxID=1419263 RepID=A0A2M8RCZ5_9BRAD|nr:hypothetical protein CVM73_09075 [Bradyrhizobium forestalis]
MAALRLQYEGNVCHYSAVMPRLDRVIQYAAAHRFNHYRLGVLDRPVKPGDDSGGRARGRRLDHRPSCFGS